MKRFPVIVCSVLFVLGLFASCSTQTVTIGDQTQQNTQIIGSGTASGDEHSTADIQQQTNDPPETDVSGSSINLWLLLLLIPVFLVGIWFIYIIIKVYKNRRQNMYGGN